MFTSDTPRLFGVPPGTDFCRVFVDGLLARAPADPFALARTTVYVNTRRTGRRITELLAASGARLLPRILPVAELGLSEPAGLPPPVPALRRRLQLTQVIRTLLDRQPELAPRAAAYDLADTLAALMEEMADESIEPETLIGQDFGELSQHWERSAELLSLIARYFGPDSDAERTPAARLAAVIAALTRRWDESPPQDPVIVAGSTGSRGSTHALMRAVARLPQGAVVLPGFDFDLPAPVWDVIADTRAEDHPQYRFARLCRALDTPPSEVAHWGDCATAPRNRLISLALRPAPVSDQWIVEGPALGPLDPATEGLTLIEAPSTRAEALAIALALRQAVEAGQTAALVTPDRRLSRTVAAELDRWGILPDDSAGQPLGLSAAGRLLRLTAEALATPPAADNLLTLLKHPMVAAGPGRVRHLDTLRQVDLALRRNRHPYPDAHALRAAVPEGAETWADWLIEALPDAPTGHQALADHLRLHIAFAEALAAGPEATGSPWAGEDGAEALRQMATLQREAEHGGWMTAVEYRDLMTAILERGEVRQAVTGHPQVKIWGTIEARVQGADLVILAGLNEGTWPAHPAPDPWLNRAMRRTVGLTSPERRIGLAAHDFQQAVSQPRVILSRATRVESAETVPARWLSRLTNLLDGLTAGAPALKAMRDRGAELLALADRMDRRLPRESPAHRPAPRPPVAARPRGLSVTEIQTLIRDPYAIYARHVLGLRKLDPLRPEPDAPLQGSVLHGALEDFVRATLDDPGRITPDALIAIADAALVRSVPWPGIRAVWRAKVAGFADWFTATELERRRFARPVIVEKKRRLALTTPAFELSGKPDRIDLHEDGTAEIIDYKSGKLPAPKDVERFDRQLMLLALMVEGGAFEELAGRRVSTVTHYGLGAADKRETPLTPDDVETAGRQLARLLARYLDPAMGYASRRMHEKARFEGDYDHLSRLGEWSAADWPLPEDVG